MEQNFEQNTENNTQQNNEDFKTDILNQSLFEISGKCNINEETLNKMRSILFLNFYNYDVIPKKYELVVQSRTNEILWRKFLVTKKAENLSNHSLDYYKGTLEQFSWVVKKNFLAVTADDIRFFLLTKEKEGVSPCTLDNLRRGISSFYRWMQDEAIRHDNPIAKIKKIRGNTAEKNPYSRLEIEKIRGACKEPIEKAIIEVLLSSAIRAKELTRIKVQDLNFQRKEIKIIRKGNRLGYAILNAKAIVALQEYLKTRQSDAGEYIWIQNADERVTFEPNPDESYLQAHVTGIVKKIGERAGVKNVHLHKFRRTVATIALQKGMPIEEVQQLLGHLNINTTMIYTKIDREDIVRRHNKLMD